MIDKLKLRILLFCWGKMGKRFLAPQINLGGIMLLRRFLDKFSCHRAIFCCALILLTLALTSCERPPAGDTIVGKWKGRQTEDGIMVFHANGTFDMLYEDKASVFDYETKPNMTWEAITEVEPYQVYITMKAKDKTQRMPLGIYKIENNKLILRQPTEIHRTLGGFDMGVSRYEIPKDFSGIVQVFERTE